MTRSRPRWGPGQAGWLFASLALVLAWPAAAGEPAAEAVEDARTAPKLRLRAWTALSLYDGGSWMGGGVNLRGQIFGPVWLSGGLGLDTRPSAGLSTDDSTRALPARLGFRFEAELAAGIRIRGGGDLLMILELPPDETGRGLRVEPGGQLSIGLSLPLGGPLAFSLEAAAGAIHRETASPLEGLPAGAGPEPRFQLSIGLDVGLAPLKVPGQDPG